MPTIQELKNQADLYFKNENFADACLTYLEILESEKNEINGKVLLNCYRKAEKYIEAYELYNTLIAIYPNSGSIKLAKLWLDYSCKIKDWKNPDLISDAEALITKTDKYNQYTGNIFNKTVLSVVKYLRYKADYPKALEWLDKLDFTILKNTPFNYNGIKYPSDQKLFFILYTDVLIQQNNHIDYIENCLTRLNFEGIKHTQFKKKIIEEITFGDYVSRVVLALYLKLLKEEIYHREKNVFKQIYTPNKITLISDLGDFEFCPVSFAISETFNVPSNSTWEKDEW